MYNPSFLGLPDRMILQEMNRIENDFFNNKIDITSLRTKFSEYYSIAVSPELKKFILMEYDGLEIGAKRVIT